MRLIENKFFLLADAIPALVVAVLANGSRIWAGFKADWRAATWFAPPKYRYYDTGPNHNPRVYRSHLDGTGLMYYWRFGWEFSNWNTIKQARAYEGCSFTEVNRRDAARLLDPNLDQFYMLMT